jgi:hypothetical protein
VASYAAVRCSASWLAYENLIREAADESQVKAPAAGVAVGMSIKHLAWGQKQHGPAIQFIGSRPVGQFLGGTLLQPDGVEIEDQPTDPFRGAPPWWRICQPRRGSIRSAHYLDTYFNLDRRHSATAPRTNSNATSKSTYLSSLSIITRPPQ